MNFCIWSNGYFVNRLPNRSSLWCGDYISSSLSWATYGITNVPSSETHYTFYVSFWSLSRRKCVSVSWAVGINRSRSTSMVVIPSN